MLVDVNVSLGHYPFRKLVGNDVAGLLATMDRHTIDMAVVCSLHSLFYRDAHSGNEDLMESIKPHAGRLMPIVTVNPKYVDWQRDLDFAVRLWKPVGVMLAPAYHGYRLEDAVGKSAMSSITETGLPLVLFQRFEDRRQRHAWDQAEDLEATSVIEVARAFPTVRMALINWSAADVLRIGRAELKQPLLFDLARLQVLLQKDYQALVKLVGRNSIAFGSHLPFDYAGSSLVKLSDIELKHPDDVELVKSKNARAFFGI